MIEIFAMLQIFQFLFEIRKLLKCFYIAKMIMGVQFGVFYAFLHTFVISLFPFSF